MPKYGRTRVDGKYFKRKGQRLRIQGVTYGPFAPNEHGDHFPSEGRVRSDIRMMQAIGINAIRTYHMPPDWLFEVLEELDMLVFAGINWPAHFCFLDSAPMKRKAQEHVRRAAERGKSYNCLLAYCIGNEIRPDIVRWQGVQRTEAFLSELADEARRADPEALITYASYPPTEYLELAFTDFITFNVYLHEQEAFSRYLMRLQNIADHKPLVLGELGMDTLRHGEAAQADHLTAQVKESTVLGAAGSFIFAWTDDWFTGGYQIEDWSFGITKDDRSPKRAYHTLAQVFDHSPASWLNDPPRVSVVVCSHNGDRTLDECLRSLEAIDYPDYEVILVDDGSTDNTRDIAKAFPEICTIHQSNMGLSAARNTGLEAATGSIIAYTDSDCYADADWLSLLVHQLQRTGAAAVGGPNLTPKDGRVPTLVSASPGQPTHVLETDYIAEHIPGCNMAFRREALEDIGGFDPMFRKAGDDVDVCWRLQEGGYWITYAPGAFVWHHRRQDPKAYLRQQAGYGEAEALLSIKHPNKFDDRGNCEWRGVPYGTISKGLQRMTPIIYSGVFGAGLFQRVYEREPPHWALLPCTLGWHVAMLAAVLLTVIWPFSGLISATMFGLSVATAGEQAMRAPLPKEHDDFKARLTVTLLSYVQPLVRSWVRLKTRMAALATPATKRLRFAASELRRHLLSPVVQRNYWSETGQHRIEFLTHLFGHLHERHWVTKQDSGWERDDVEIYTNPWTKVKLRTVQEEHAGGRSLIRTRFKVWPTGSLLRGLGLLSIVVIAALSTGGWMPALVAIALCLIVGGIWTMGIANLAYLLREIDNLAKRAGLVPIEYPSSLATEEAGSAALNGTELQGAKHANSETGHVLSPEQPIQSNGELRLKPAPQPEAGNVIKVAIHDNGRAP